MTLARTKPLKRSARPLRRVSAKRSVANRQYSRKRLAFLEAHPLCQVWLDLNGWADAVAGLYRNAKRLLVATPDDLIALGAPLAMEVHHRRCGAQRGKYFLDESTWMAVSSEGHRKIHQNPAESYARGWLQ